ncbi:MAG: tRNA (guanine37-N1)-methyltransferase [Patescibacteria group bacterium]|nr:tRNA (guanine37-N1)-methyltransferase [Patescibacteria group bacterium]
MTFHVITIFPNMFDSYLGESILARAIKEKKIKVKFYNPRDFVRGKLKKVWPDGNISSKIDDKPYGGGPGMVMIADPIMRAFEKAMKSNKKPSAKYKTVIFSPSGKKLDTSFAKSSVKKYTDLILICGRYEGIDARVKKITKAEDLSVGDYVLTGGEIPAMIVIDTVSRQIEGVLGKIESLEENRVSSSEMYTRPEVYEFKNKKYKVPAVFKSGDHKKIEEYKENSKK